MAAEITELTLGEVGRAVERVEAKLDRVIEDHEKRLRRLEAIQYIAIGLAATLGTGFGTILDRIFGG